LLRYLLEGLTRRCAPSDRVNRKLEQKISARKLISGNTIININAVAHHIIPIFMTEYYWSTPQNRVHYDGETGTVVLDWLDYNTSENFREATVKSVSIFPIKITLHQILQSS
jgi:hypothetical protein